MRLATLILAAAALLLAALLGLAPPHVALIACAPAGVLGVVGCELLDRIARKTRVQSEPWRLDGWMVMVGTLGVLTLGLALGPESVGVAWILVSLLAALAFASLANLATTKRS